MLTIPSVLRPVVGLDQASALRPMVAQLVQEWARDTWKVRVGLIVCFHPTGDTCARCGWSKGEAPDGDALGVGGCCPRCAEPAPWIPHFDVLIPLLGIATELLSVADDGHLVVAGTLRKIHFKIPGPALRDLRRRWSAMLLEVARAAGLELDGPTLDVMLGGRAGVHYSYRRTQRKKLHRFGYSMRPFPAFANADRGIGRLRTYQGFGLCGPNAQGPGVVEWRAAVAVPEKRIGLLCDCCAEKRELQAIDVVREWTARFRLWKWARLHSSCGPPE